MSQRIVASTAVFGLLTGILIIFLLVTLTGCVTEVTKRPTKYRFKDGVAYKEVRYHAIPTTGQREKTIRRKKIN